MNQVYLEKKNMFLDDVILDKNIGLIGRDNIDCSQKIAKNHIATGSKKEDKNRK